MSADIHSLHQLTQGEIGAVCPDWVALLILQVLDLIIKLHLPNAVSMQGQSCRQMPTIKHVEPTLSVYYEQ